MAAAATLSCQHGGVQCHPGCARCVARQCHRLFGAQPGRHQFVGRRAPVPGRPLRHRDAVPALGVRRVCTRRVAHHRPVHLLEQFRHQPGHLCRVRQRRVPLRPLDVDRERGQAGSRRPDVQRPRADSGLPESAGVQQRPFTVGSRSGGAHRARQYPHRGQRDRRVHRRSAAQQPGRPAAGPGCAEHRTSTRHRHAQLQRSAGPVLRDDG